MSIITFVYFKVLKTFQSNGERQDFVKNFESVTGYFCFVLKPWFLLLNKLKTLVRKCIQSNSVTTNSTGPSEFVCYNRDIIITIKVYIVK